VLRRNYDLPFTQSNRSVVGIAGLSVSNRLHAAAAELPQSVAKWRRRALRGNCRRDLLDRVIVLKRAALRRRMTVYVRYYHDDRTHLGLEKQTPATRLAVRSENQMGRLTSMPKLGGRHHRYDFAA